MGKINLLTSEVANLIAAGEVVDRPSSAVKEMLENAIDSGADKVTLEIQHGGVTFIRVADNGCGIEKDDLIPAITRHSTSKIKTAADLGSIMTLGFRGEALAAIASVSKLRIFSKLPGETMGSLLEAEGGRNIRITDTGCADGTTIIVEDLFFNVPARRKFLKKDSTEAVAVGAVMEKIALSHPEISFKFISDGEIKFLTSGNGDLRETMWALFGRDTASRSLKTDREENGIRVTGYVSEPDIVRSNRNMENFFINGRFIKSKTASAALEQAYASKIPQDKFPFCVLNIELNPAVVDVNVHPAKLEVKFADERVIYDAVYYAVLSALEAEARRPELVLGKQIHENANPFRINGTDVNPANAFAQIDKRPPKSEQIKIGNQPEEKKPAVKPSDDEAHRAAMEYLRKARYTEPDGTTDLKETKESKPAPAAVNITEPASDKPQNEENAKRVEITTESNRAASAAETKTALPAEDDAYAIYDEEIKKSDIPDYVIIGEAFNCYIIVQLDDRLLMIDKHAAHERILFDELCRNMRRQLRDGTKGGQMLLGPLECDILAVEMTALEEYSEKLRALGFDFETEKTGVSAYKVKITQIPETLDGSEAVELFQTLLTRLSDSSGSVETAAAGFFETRLWQASCKAAIKGGRVYGIDNLKWICDRLLKRDDGKNSVIRTCPHGRPVAFEIKRSSIDRQFARE